MSQFCTKSILKEVYKAEKASGTYRGKQHGPGSDTIVSSTLGQNYDAQLE